MTRTLRPGASTLGPAPGSLREFDDMPGAWFTLSCEPNAEILGREMQQVILYFLERINNVHLGRTKLMKLLYFVDFDHYEKYGESVTGAVYRKLPHGPYPKDEEKLIKKMQQKGL